MSKFREWICSVTGHWFHDVDVIIFKIKTNELNRDMTAKITCFCCKDVFIHKDAPDTPPEEN